MFTLVTCGIAVVSLLLFICTIFLMITGGEGSIALAPWVLIFGAVMSTSAFFLFLKFVSDWAAQ